MVHTCQEMVQPNYAQQPGQPAGADCLCRYIWVCQLLPKTGSWCQQGSLRNDSHLHIQSA